MTPISGLLNCHAGFQKFNPQHKWNPFALQRRALFAQFRKAKADFILLQETHSTSNDEKIWLSEWGGTGVFCHGRFSAMGTTVRDCDGRFLILQILTGTERVTLVNVYAPTSNEPANQTLLMGKIQEHLAELEIQNLFEGGDFNVKLDETDINSTPARDLYIAQIDELLSDYTLVDVWKRKNQLSTRGTFHRHTYSARLDYLFAPEYLLSSISSAQITPEPLSDHCAVSMQVNIPTSPRGPGYWRFENYLLTDQTFVGKM